MMALESYPTHGYTRLLSLTPHSVAFESNFTHVPAVPSPPTLPPRATAVPPVLGLGGAVQRYVRRVQPLRGQGKTPGDST